MREIYLIDANIYIHRAWSAVSLDVCDSDGRPINALVGFSDFLLRLLRHERPSHVMMAFDESACFRHRLHTDYKSNRSAKDPDLLRQQPLCRALAEHLGVYCLSSEDYEADDIIGTVSRHYRNDGYQCQFVSRDKDIAQLMRPGDHWWGGQNSRPMDYCAVAAKFGVYPEQIADYLALVGDASDCIPGVPGIGKKRAAKLLAHHHSAEELINNGVLDESEVAIVRHALRLTRIVCEAPLPPDALSRCERQPLNEEALTTLSEQTPNPSYILRRWLSAGAA